MFYSIGPLNKAKTFRFIILTYVLFKTDASFESERKRRSMAIKYVHNKQLTKAIPR